MRRARIKAIATVPVRRKAQETINVEEPPNSKGEDKEKVNVNQTDTLTQKSIKKDVIKENVIKEPSQSLNNDAKSIDNEGGDITNTKVTDNAIVQIDVKNEHSKNITKKNVESSESSNVVENTAVSPTKLGQPRSCFTKPTPRLDNSNNRIRKNSIQGNGASASESEEDSKRTNVTTNRNRNDSICSIQSNKESPDNISFLQLKTRQKRRQIMPSESTRKFAEARKEFLIKHGNKSPDKSKLTMYDLIYYNPVTNPMTKSNETTATRESYPSECEPQEEQSDDEPLPVPQVKVGPDGQLIVDEQSLVIDQTDTKKHKQILAKKAIVDDGSTSGGFYKKYTKQKDWSKWETLMFYRVLSIVGTDFLVMQKLFPKRSRRELKLKFKREERINRKFIEKAFACRQDFDIEALKKEVADLKKLEQGFSLSTADEENLDAQVQKKADKRNKRKRKLEKRYVATSIRESSANDELQSTSSENTRTESNNNQSQKRTKKKRNESVSLSESDSDNNELGSNTEVYHARPTKSGRSPKVRKLQGPDINLLDKTTDKNKEMQNSSASSTNKNSSEEVVNEETNLSNTNTIANKDDIPNINDVEPGSLVILSKEVPEEPGKTVLQVYMVGNNTDSSNNRTGHKITPVDLPPDILSTVSTKLSNAKTHVNMENRKHA